MDSAKPRSRGRPRRPQEVDHRQNRPASMGANLGLPRDEDLEFEAAQLRKLPQDSQERLHVGTLQKMTIG